MKESIILYPVIIPVIISLLILIMPKKDYWAKSILSLIGVTLNLILSIFLFGKTSSFLAPWFGFGFNISFRLYHFSGLMVLASAIFSFCTVLYSMVFMRGKDLIKQFYFFLILSVGMINGAILANNLLLLLFFWEGLMLTLFVLILTGGKKSFSTAVKAFVLGGVPDLFMMLGIIITGYFARTFEMDKIHLPLISGGNFAFILLMTGAIAKAGSMPFHSWIPDAAIDAPLPFMAFLPAALEKILGIYFLTRISIDLFAFNPGSAMSYTMMTIGAVTIILAVMMALVQTDFKRLLAYHAISQVGYMILGIGTALPIGIVGGIFHMINNAMYKSTLFYTGGAVEKEAGTTDLKELGGIGKRMPITFICFLITAASISGVPPFNGFFSKELVFDGALMSGKIFYFVALLGAFFTAASFLKLGHAAFLGKSSNDYSRVKETSWVMLIPMIFIALACILFGVYNPLPLKLIQPILGAKMAGQTFAGLPHNWTLAIVSVVVLLLALLNHFYGVSRTKRGLGAVDHIHYAPVLSTIYLWAEKRYFDPYDIGMYIVHFFARIFWAIDRGIDWFYNTACVWVATSLSNSFRKAYSGNHSVFVSWSLIGILIIIVTVLVLM